jgi:hypothetical protein
MLSGYSGDRVCIQCFSGSQFERQAMTRRVAGSADARKIGSVMATMIVVAPFEGCVGYIVQRYNRWERDRWCELQQHTVLTTVSELA